MKKEKEAACAGYHEIGMDHFALESDAMYQSFQAGTHRNFMGYTASKTQVMIGLGISSSATVGIALRKMKKNSKIIMRDSKTMNFLSRGHILVLKI
jgi:oxygen-independent coproporphyrinogen-3 oxidase